MDQNEYNEYKDEPNRKYAMKFSDVKKHGTSEEKDMVHIREELETSHGAVLRAMFRITGDGPFQKNEYPDLHKKLKKVADKIHEIIKEVDKKLP